MFFATTMVISGLVVTLFGPLLGPLRAKAVMAQTAFGLVSPLAAARTVQLAGWTGGGPIGHS